MVNYRLHLDDYLSRIVYVVVLVSALHTFINTHRHTNKRIVYN